MKRDVITVNLGDSVKKASRIMDEHHIGCLLVVDQGSIAGIITSGDIRRAHPNRIVDDVMTRNVFSVAPETPLIEVMQIIDEKGLKYLPVVQDDELKGIISKTDVIGEIGKHVDSLTGLYQSVYMKSRLQKLIANNQPFTLVFIDFDNFSGINKEYGHVIGDQILCEFTINLNKSLGGKSEITCYRYGGDEFAVIIESADDTYTSAVIKSILQSLSAITLPNGDRMSGSLGIVNHKKTGPNRKRDEADKLCLKIINTASKASTRAKDTKGKFLFAEVC